MGVYSEYFAIEKEIKSQGFDIDRHEAVETFTDGRTNSLRGMGFDEYKAFIAWLKIQFKISPGHNIQCDKMRKKIIMLFKHKMGYTMEGLDEWCIQYGKFHKGLNQHNYDELVQLVSQAEKVYQSHVSELQRISRHG